MYIYIVHPAVYGSIKTCYAINTESERNVCILVCELWWVCETKPRRSVGEEDKTRREMRLVGEGGGVGWSILLHGPLTEKETLYSVHTHTHTHSLTHYTQPITGGAYTDISHILYTNTTMTHIQRNCKKYLLSE